MPRVIVRQIDALTTHVPLSSTTNVTPEPSGTTPATIQSVEPSFTSADTGAGLTIQSVTETSVNATIQPSMTSAPSPYSYPAITTDVSSSTSQDEVIDTTSAPPGSTSVVVTSTLPTTLEVTSLVTTRTVGTSTFSTTESGRAIVTHSVVTSDFVTAIVFTVTPTVGPTNSPTSSPLPPDNGGDNLGRREQIIIGVAVPLGVVALGIVGKCVRAR